MLKNTSFDIKQADDLLHSLDIGAIK